MRYINDTTTNAWVREIFTPDELKEYTTFETALITLHLRTKEQLKRLGIWWMNLNNINAKNLIFGGNSIRKINGLSLITFITLIMRTPY